MRKLNVLCCDDNALHLKLIEGIVKGSGHNTKSVTSFYLVKEEDYNCDVFITDYVMEGVNGLEFAKIIKQKKPKSLVIIISDSNPLLGKMDFEIDDNVKIVFKGEDASDCIKSLLHTFCAEKTYRENNSYKVV